MMNDEETKKPIETLAKEILEIKQKRRSLRIDLGEYIQGMEKFAELKKHQDEAKKLKAEIESDSKVERMRNELKDYLERLGLVAEIFSVRAKEEQLTLFGTQVGLRYEPDISDFVYNFIVKDKLKIEKIKKKKRKFGFTKFEIEN
jgi:Na+/phosphate symporter